MATGEVMRIQKKGPEGVESWGSTASLPCTATWAWPPQPSPKGEAYFGAVSQAASCCGNVPEAI